MNTVRKRKLLLPFVLTAALLLALTGCGGDSESPNGEGTPQDDGGIEQSTIKMGTVAPGGSTPELHLGIQEGIFEEHGLEVEEVLGGGGAAQVPALVSGELDVVAGNWVPLLQAKKQGIDLQQVSAAGSIINEGIHGFFVQADSNIQSAEDFVGKTLAVNTLGNIGEIAYKEAMEGAGVDPEGGQLTELGFGDMSSALEQGNIDVAWLPGPFYAAAETNPNLRLVMDFTEMPAIKGLPNVGFVAMTDWAQSNPNTIKALGEGLHESVEYITENEDAVRAMNVEVSGFTQEQADALALEVHLPAVPTKDLERLMELMVKWGLLDEPINLDELLLPME